MRILVTGGAGFVGSHYVRTLLTGGYPDCADATVTVLDKLTYAGNLANLDPVTGRFAFVHGDICDAALLAGVLPGHDVVVNFAAETHVDRSIAGAAEFVATNVSGVQVLLRRVQARRLAGVRRVVHVSTDEVYGSIAAGSWTEGAPLDPSSPYSAAKAGGDLLACATSATGSTSTTTAAVGHGGARDRPARPRPALQPRRLAAAVDGIRAEDPVPRRAEGHRRVVRGQPLLVGAAAQARAPRADGLTGRASPARRAGPPASAAAPGRRRRR